MAIIFLITGLTISTEVLYRQFKSYRLHLATQVISLLVFPTLVFIILSIIRASDDPAINPYILVGLMFMGVLPTTVASNITMTRGADGNVEATTVEVVIGMGVARSVNASADIGHRTDPGHLPITAVVANVLFRLDLGIR